MKNFAKSKGKRITAALLCAVMCIMSLPLSAFAFTAEEGKTVDAYYGDRYFGSDGDYYYSPESYQYIAYDENGNTSLHSAGGVHRRTKLMITDSTGSRQIMCIESGIDYNAGGTYSSVNGKNSSYFQNLPTTAQYGIMLTSVYGWRPGKTAPISGTNEDDFSYAIQAYHGYLSFKDEPNITPELAQQIGTEFAKRVWGDRFQVVVTTHLNTKHLHCHFVVNSVSFVDGKRMQNNEKHWRYFRHVADELCRQHQLDVIENPKRGTGKNYYARKLHEAGMPNYVDSAKAVIDEAISKSNSYADFKYILRQMGASFDDSPNHKYQVLRVKGYQKNIRLTRLGDDYSLDRIKERIYENRNRVRLEPFQKGYYYRPKQYVLLTREHKIRKVGGLYGLYLHYCYKLGYLPKYQKQNPARLHYLLREDLMKLDQITAQVRLLGREHISTSEQLFSYKSKVEDEIKSLTADRTHLRNEIRKVNIDDDLLSGKRQQISALSERLKELRKEVRLCDGIAERSGVMRENLNAVLADEEKIKNNRKENRDYEHRR